MKRKIIFGISSIFSIILLNTFPSCSETASEMSAISASNKSILFTFDKDKKVIAQHLLKPNRSDTSGTIQYDKNMNSTTVTGTLFYPIIANLSTDTLSEQLDMSFTFCYALKKNKKVQIAIVRKITEKEAYIEKVLNDVDYRGKVSCRLKVENESIFLFGLSYIDQTTGKIESTNYSSEGLINRELFPTLRADN